MKTRWTINLVSMIFLFTLSKGFAAPVPGLSSAKIPQLLKNIVISERGFRMGSTSQTFWALKDDINSNAKDTFQFVGSPANSTARLTINVDRFSKPMSFDSYIKKSVKEYPYFGFEILKSQQVKLGGEPCYLVDLAHRQKNKQLRQYVAVRKDYALVMTCADNIDKFRDTSAQCAQMISNFQWTSPALNQ